MTVMFSLSGSRVIILKPATQPAEAKARVRSGL